MSKRNHGLCNVPNGTVRQNQRIKPPGAQPRGSSDVAVAGVSAEEHRRALRALEIYLELALKAAEKYGILTVFPRPPANPGDPAQRPDPVVPVDPVAPIDQVAADWADRTTADEIIIHAFLGLDAGDEEKVDDGAENAQPQVWQKTAGGLISEGRLQSGEKAAIGAFEQAQAQSSGAKDALIAAIEAADLADKTGATIGHPYN